MQGGSKYDLILMDIIMPNLDGVSACHLIRQFDRTPIIAMTSNIRSDDIQLYFQHGKAATVILALSSTRRISTNVHQ
jgi:osomolarity two-component system response regulator SKN7